MNTDEIIERWRQVYFQYLTHIGVPDWKHDEAWVNVSNGLMSQWNKMAIGEITKIYDSFFDMIMHNIDLYQRLIENYERDSRKKPVEVIPSNGGRYWL